MVTSAFGVYANNTEQTCTTSETDYNLLQMLEEEKEYLDANQYKELKGIYTQIEKLEKEENFDEADKLWEKADAIYDTVEGFDFEDEDFEDEYYDEEGFDGEVFDLTEEQEAKLEELETKLEKIRKCY